MTFILPRILCCFSHSNIIICLFFPLPNEGLDAGIVQKPSFKLSHEEVGIGGGHPCTHCCAVDLEVVLFPKDQRILVQDLGDQLWW